MDVLCRKCSGVAEAIETATAHLDESPRADLTLRCGCGVTWMLRGVSMADAIELARSTITAHRWSGATRAALGMLLEVTGQVDDAYREYANALVCNGAFDRAFCLERRGVYEAAHGWLRNALHSLRRALTEDRAASGARVAAFQAGIEQLEGALTASGIKFPAPDRDATDKQWQRHLELELPPGLGARNELGELLTEDVIEVERLVRAERYDDAVTALKALEPNRLVDAIGYASRGAELARSTQHHAAAIALQELVVHAYVMWASWSTSGGEGISRTADVERERKRLREWQLEV